MTQKTPQNKNQLRLTTVRFIRVVVTVIVSVTTPKLEGTAAIFTLELIGFAGRRSTCGETRGQLEHGLSSESAHVHKALLPTTSELVAPVRAVPLSVADVVARDTLSALARGLIGSAGSRRDGGLWRLPDGGGCGGRGGEDWR